MNVLNKLSIMSYYVLCLMTASKSTQDAQMWPGQVFLRGQVIKQEKSMKTNNTRDLCFKLYNLEHDHNGCS